MSEAHLGQAAGSQRAYRVGLTGGIGSGKSAVGHMLTDRGAVVIDADQVARDVVAPGTDGLAALVSEFGPQILAPDGSLDRPGLARYAFADEQATARLNAIVHPLIAERTATLMGAVGPGSIIVHEVPLLAELGLASAYDLVVVVDAPDEVRLARLIDRGMEPGDAAARMGSQASREDRLAIADVVLDNAGTQDELSAQVDALWAQIRAAAALG